MMKSASAKAVLWLLFNVLFLRCALAQDAKGGPIPRVKIPKQQVHSAARRAVFDQEFQAIADMAMSVPPEFGADAMIRLSESGKATSAVRTDLLKKAFYLAQSAEHAVKRGTNEFMPDTRSGSLALAFRIQNLDRLSLQSRVVTDMLPLNTKLARELLADIQFPVLEPVDCKEPLTYDVTLFYQTVGLVEHDGFTFKDTNEGRKLPLLAPYVGSLQSHAQIRPAAELLANADLSAVDLGQLSNMFADALSELHGDERSFASTNMQTDEYSAPGSIARLIAVLDARNIPSVALLRAFREYLVSNFGSDRCAETAKKSTDNTLLPDAIQYFNQHFRLALEKNQILPIAGDELKGGRIGPKFVDTSFWQSPEAKQLEAGARELRFGNGAKRLTASDKVKSGWSSQLLDFLTKLGAWKPESEPAVDYFCQKSILYSLLIDVVPSGPERSKVISDFVEFLEQNSVQPASRIEWILPVERLLSGAVAADDRDEVVQAFLNSRDPVLSLYARLENWEPRKKRPASKRITGLRIPKNDYGRNHG